MVVGCCSGLPAPHVYNRPGTTALRIGDQLIRFDRDAAISADPQIEQGDADRCACVGCRNFAALRNKAYPDVFRAFLNTLAIDPDKEGEAVHYGAKVDLHFTTDVSTSSAKWLKLANEW